jgi:hypothetical protein
MSRVEYSQLYVSTNSAVAIFRANIFSERRNCTLKSSRENLRTRHKFRLRYVFVATTVATTDYYHRSTSSYSIYVRSILILSSHIGCAYGPSFLQVCRLNFKMWAYFFYLPCVLHSLPSSPPNFIILVDPNM